MPMPDERSRWWGRWALTRRANLPWGAIAALCLLPLLGMVYVGTFSRYLADDYCTAGVLRSNGFWNGLGYWYLGWTGRFSYITLVQILQLFGPGVAPFATILLLVLWALAMFLLLRNLSRRSGVHASWSTVAALAAALLLSMVLATPDRYQSLYWLTGIATKTAPLVLLTFYAAWLASGWGQSGSSTRLGVAGAASFSIAFAAGGFSEVSVSAQLILLGIGLVCARLFLPPPSRRAMTVVLAVGLAGTIAAILAILIAPGNQVRLALMPERPPLPILLLSTGRFAAAFVAKSLLQSPGPAILALFVPFVLGLSLPPIEALRTGGPRRRSGLLALIPLAAALLTVLASVFPEAYATSAYPAERSLVIPQYALIWGLAGTGYLAGGVLRESGPGKAGLLGPSLTNALQVTALVLVLVVSAAGAKSILDFAPEARSFAEQWEARHAKVLAAGNVSGTLAIASLPHMAGLAEVGEDPAEWINVCVAAAYALDAVVAK
jgi:hypothetical protein